MRITASIRDVLSIGVAAGLLAGCGPSFALRQAQVPPLGAPSGSHHPVETILYAFKGGKDGIGPGGALVMDARGAIYGATSLGGSGNCYNGCGTIFKLTPHGSGYAESIIYRFQGATDGGSPAGGLTVDDAGVLYGTTLGGSSGCPPSCGTVYELLPKKSGWVHTVLYRFAGGSDGYGAYGGVIVDGSGSLYGTTYAGGTQGAGSAYKLTPTKSGYEKSTIFSFGGAHDAHPVATLLFGKDGALYGTAVFSSVFELIPKAQHYNGRIMHILDGSGGQLPYAPVVPGAGGKFYGTTYEGGVTSRCKSHFGCGTAFELSPAPGGYRETDFKFQHVDGAYPLVALLLGKTNGALYGTTSGGGLETCPSREPTYGCGIAFELVASGSGFKETILHKFAGGTDGAGPSSALIADAGGSLIGTTGGGGSAGCSSGCGIVFKITP
ncbi:MAG TPA: choice-of-anchor tandem repeat GloVer-containing protein [Candidatus Cybelea sp.]